MRLLIVEDEAIIARDLAVTVEAFGHVVVGVVDSGEAALEFALAQRPDLVLMDICLSGLLDGIAAAEQLHLPVVYLTAHADSETMRRAAATQPLGYLLKPFDERALWSMLEIAAHQQQLALALQTEVRIRQQAEVALRDSNAQLQAALRTQEQRVAELRVLSNLSGALMRCTLLDDGYVLVTQAAQQLFPNAAGALYAARPAAPDLDPVIGWGGAPQQHQPLRSTDCRALREYRMTLSAEPCSGCHCSMLPPNISPQALCVPLSVTQETLGVLHLHLPVAGSATADAAAHLQLALAFGEQAALGLANIHMRAVLHEQSIRDPLTGLFNRRYLEETLLRELHRATRDHYPVGVIMLDVDHFKRINDDYGHEAGDTVLRALGALLLGMVRAGDMACRYGGEEFVLIMPTAPLPVLAGRAEAIRQAISTLVIPYHAGELPPLTASLGVSIVASADISVAAALACADEALYAAKHAGRNRVVILP